MDGCRQEVAKGYAVPGALTLDERTALLPLQYDFARDLERHRPA